jgi:hypothetical protein
MAGIVRNSRIILVSLLLTTLLMILFTNLSIAQDEDSRKGPKHFLGAKAGRNFSWLNLEPTVNQNLVMGPVIGISYTYMPQHFGGLMIEAQYIQYGWEEVFTDSTNTYSRQLNYLELPILSNIVLGKKKTHFKLQAGIKIAMLLNDKETSDLAEEEVQYYNGLEVDDPFELGLAFGASISRVFPIGELQIDGRFNAGLSNLFEPADDLSLLYSQNQSLTLSIYYWFKVK